jgi:hypothetical protein
MGEGRHQAGNHAGTGNPQCRPAAALGAEPARQTIESGAVHCDRFSSVSHAAPGPVPAKAGPDTAHTGPATPIHGGLGWHRFCSF